jgi:hypothetical protein
MSSYLTQPTIERIWTLLKEIREGRLRVPRFQRAFVWRPDQRIELMESIYEGQPIGALLFWRTRHLEIPFYDWRGVVPVEAPRDHTRETRDYVLDGHQRLTTLYSALGAGLFLPDDVGDFGAEDEGEQPEGGPIYFDLEEQVFKFWQRRGDPPPTWLPMSILLDDFRMDAFRQKLPESPDRRRWYNRAAHLQSRFKDYTIPTIPLVTDDLGVAVQTFVRVNKSGTQVGEVDLMNALTWSKEYDLNTRIEETRGRLRQIGWDLEPDLILKVYRAVLGIDLHKVNPEEQRDRLLQEPDIVDRVGSALTGAIGFLQAHCWVHGPELLPNTYQLVLLAECFSRGAPDAAGLDFLERWFWATSFGESFASVHNARLNRMRQVLADGPGADLLKRLELDRAIRPAAADTFKSNGARTRALILVQLRDLKPRSLGGDPLSPSEVAGLGSQATPQFFARKDLEGHSLDDVRLLLSAANRFIALPDEARALRQAVLEASPTITPAIQQSHAIDPTAWEWLKKRDRWFFLRLRRTSLVELESRAIKAAGLTVEVRRP